MPKLIRSLFAVLLLGSSTQAAITVSPRVVELHRPEATGQVLVTHNNEDVTRLAKFTVANPAVAGVDSRGRVSPIGEGRTELLIQVGTETARIPIEITGLKSPRRVSFDEEIIPILTKSSCNSGGCHGKAEGQGGLKLSVFGFDPDADYRALVQEGRGRRIFPAAPQSSLLLLKATGTIPHGGGKKLAPNTWQYQRLVRWLREGAQPETEELAPVVSLEVEPKERTLKLSGSQQLRVTAVLADSARRDVTAETEFESNAGLIAGVDGSGLITAGMHPGEAAILVRYMGHVSVSRVTIPRPGVNFPRPAENNFIDKLVWNKLTQLGIPPSDLADDATFLRRVSLDTIGTLPTAAEAAQFLADPSPDKRSKLIDRLLDRPEYADFWAMKWSDILKVDKDAVTPEGAVAMTRWIHEQFAENRPYDEFAVAVVTARGDTAANGPAAIFKSLTTPEIAARSMSQVFLGVRIECAQCHHHPSERWAQEDYWAFAGLFSGVARKKLPSGSEAIVWKNGVDLGPALGKKGRKAVPTVTYPAKPLGAPAPDFTPDSDRRQVLAKWMTAKENPYFAAVIVNRLWAHYFGRGLVDPIDDLRATNPASNEPLLAALVQHLRDEKYNLKTFTKTLLNSRVYQLSSTPNAQNADDGQNFSHATVKPMSAEVLLDSISQVTGVPEKFNGWPEGYRAIQIWDNRMPSYFFRIFGRPVRFSVCECERGTDPSIAQALHLMNSPEIAEKIQSRHGFARRLADSDKSHSAIVEELFLSALSRKPTTEEQTRLLEVFQDGNRRAASEDVMWALLNSKEFLYNR